MAGLVPASRSEERRAPDNRDHRHKAGDDVVAFPVLAGRARGKRNFLLI
jgi:hypothetical protein